MCSGVFDDFPFSHFFSAAKRMEENSFEIKYFVLLTFLDFSL